MRREASPSLDRNEEFVLVKDYGLQQPERGKKLLMFFKDAMAWNRVRIRLDGVNLRSHLVAIHGQ